VANEEKFTKRIVFGDDVFLLSNRRFWGS